MQDDDRACSQAVEAHLNIYSKCDIRGRKKREGCPGRVRIMCFEGYGGALKKCGQMECEVNGLTLGLFLIFSSPMSCVLR
jgi:hypothetical protein